MRVDRAYSVDLAPQLTHDGATGAVRGPVDGRVDIGLGILHHYVRQAFERYLDVATHIPSAFGSVDIRQPHPDSGDVLVPGAQRKGQPPLDVVAQTVRFRRRRNGRIV